MELLIKYREEIFELNLYTYNNIMKYRIVYNTKIYKVKHSVDTIKYFRGICANT